MAILYMCLRRETIDFWEERVGEKEGMVINKKACRCPESVRADSYLDVGISVSKVKEFPLPKWWHIIEIGLTAHQYGE